MVKIIISKDSNRTNRNGSHTTQNPQSLHLASLFPALVSGLSCSFSRKTVVLRLRFKGACALMEFQRSIYAVKFCSGRSSAC